MLLEAIKSHNPKYKQNLFIINKLLTIKSFKPNKNFLSMYGNTLIYLTIR